MDQNAFNNYKIPKPSAATAKLPAGGMHPVPLDFSAVALLKRIYKPLMSDLNGSSSTSRSAR